MRRRLRRFDGPLVTIALLTMSCEGFDTQQQIRVPADATVTVESADRLSPLHLPEDQPFNIHIHKSSQEPGPTGEARSDAEAEAGGTAFAEARASDGGNSSAQFFLGHRIRYQLQEASDIQAELNYDLLQLLDAPLEAEPGTLASIDLQLKIVDNKKQALAEVSLVDTDSDEAAGTSRLTDDRILKVRFQPGQYYDILITGQTEADAAPTQKARARLEVKNLRMKLSFGEVATRPG